MLCRMSRAEARWLVALSPGCLLLACLGGCSKDPWGVGPTVPVRGRVLVDGKPLAGGLVIFQADTAQGNGAKQEPRGTIDRDGNYGLMTGGKPGAPPGRYKVSVIATSVPIQPDGRHKPGPWLIAPRYGNSETSGLTVHVAEDAQAGAYDFRLSQKGPKNTRK